MLSEALLMLKLLVAHRVEMIEEEYVTNSRYASTPGQNPQNQVCYHITIVNYGYMTNVSKHKLPSKVQKQLFTQFTNLFVAAEQKKLALVFDALFTDAEKIMFIKRIAIILMLKQNLSVYAIARSLKVTEETVRSHRERYESGEYDAIVKVIKKKSFNIDEFFTGLDALLRLGMPSYGKSRWKSLKM